MGWNTPASGYTSLSQLPLKSESLTHCPTSGGWPQCARDRIAPGIHSSDWRGGSPASIYVETPGLGAPESTWGHSQRSKGFSLRPVKSVNVSWNHNSSSYFVGWRNHLSGWVTGLDIRGGAEFELWPILRQSSSSVHYRMLPSWAGKTKAIKPTKKS